MADRVYQIGLVWLHLDNRPSLSAVGGVVMAFARQRISAQRIAQPAVAAIAAGRFQRGPGRGYWCPAAGGAWSTKRVDLAALAVRHLS